MSKIILVAGGGGFIGGHLAAHLIGEGHQIRCVDIKPMDQWYQVHGDAENIVADLKELHACQAACEDVGEVLQSGSRYGWHGIY